MAILGKNGLFAGAMYLAALFGLYGMKNVSFKDSKEIDAMDIIVNRKGKPSKSEITKFRKTKLNRLLQSKGDRYKELLEQESNGFR